MKSWAAILVVLCCSAAIGQEQPPESVPYKMEIPSGLRAWYRNPDG